MSTTCEDITRFKWHIANFPQFFASNYQTPAYSKTFNLSNFPELQFCMIFSMTPSGDGFYSGIMLKETNGFKELEAKVRFWTEQNQLSWLSASGHSYRERICTFKKIGDHCMNSNIGFVLDSFTNVLVTPSSLTLCCEIAPAKPIEHAVTLKNPCLLRKKLWNYHDQGLENSVSIKVGEEEFKVGRDILASYSEVFASMLSSKFKEGKSDKIEINDFDKQVVDGFIKWMYLGELNCAHLLEEMFIFGDKYLINELKEHCVQKMVATLKDENVIRYLVCALQYNMEFLVKKILDFLTCKPPNEKLLLFQCEAWHRFSLEEESKAKKFLEEICNQV